MVGLVLLVVGSGPEAAGLSLGKNLEVSTSP